MKTCFFKPVPSRRRYIYTFSVSSIYPSTQLSSQPKNFLWSLSSWGKKDHYFFAASLTYVSTGMVDNPGGLVVPRLRLQILFLPVYWPRNKWIYDNFLTVVLHVFTTLTHSGFHSLRLSLTQALTHSGSHSLRLSLTQALTHSGFHSLALILNVLRLDYNCCITSTLIGFSSFD